MTMERKIEILKDLLIQLSDSANILCTCEADERCEVIEECIKALEQETVSKETYDREHFARKEAEQKLWELQQNVSEDCVSRQAVDRLCFRYLESPTYEHVRFYEEFCSLPTITPTRKSGLHWIERFNNEDKWLECPYCHKDSDNAYNYCPNCGVSFKAEKRGNENDSN